ncbi:MAG: hypothetical protein ACKN9V_06635, partial [Pseudomonadota bacterium]
RALYLRGRPGSQCYRREGTNHKMRNKLQYLYSISVLMGVLATSYFMVDQKPGRLSSVRPSQGISYRAEATLAPQALDQLLQFESQFKVIEEKSQSSQIRQLTESQRKKLNKIQTFPSD